MAAENTPNALRAPAKIRILDTAMELFYHEGIRSAGVDRIIAASSVTKATFYKHYGSKDNLIIEYMTRRHESARAEVENIIQSTPSTEDAVRAIFAAIGTEIAGTYFRGCPFINAAAEFPESDHPVRLIITKHRDWYTEVLTDLMRTIGHPVPGDAADELLQARDGALSGGYIGDSIAAIAALHRMTERVLAEAGSNETDATAHTRSPVAARV